MMRHNKESRTDGGGQGGKEERGGGVKEDKNRMDALTGPDPWGERGGSRAQFQDVGENQFGQHQVGIQMFEREPANAWG